MGVPIPIEIVTKILSYLGKNDLLTCRLVSQSWNGLALKILRNSKYGHYHQLTHYNIEEFLEFSIERNEEWVLPIHLNFRLIRYERENEESLIYHKIPNYIRQLHSRFGEKCVGGLTLSLDSYWPLGSMKALISIITLVAPTLIYLNVSEFKVRYDEGEEDDRMKVKEMLGKTELSLSNLSKLISCPGPILVHEDGREEKNENELHAFLIAKSQNLKELRVISSLDLSVIHKHAGSLRRLQIMEPLQHLDTLALPSLPVLSQLWMTYSTELLDHDILLEFLSSFSTSLQRLTVEFMEIPTNSFPKLSHLKFLRIHVLTPVRARVRVDLEKLNLTSETFPVLESMDIQTNVYFGSTDENSASPKDDWILRTVKNLRIRVTDSPFDADEVDQNGDLDDEEIISRASAKDYVNNLQELFPNVTSLTLVNEDDTQEENLNELLIEFIQSDGAPKIKELEIQNYEKNSLGHILNGLDDPDLEPIIIIKNMKVNEKFLKAVKKMFHEFSGGSQLSVDKQLEFRDGAESRVITCKSPTPLHLKMTNIEKIKIHTNLLTKFYSGQLEIEPESNQKDLFLMSLPKHLPLLRQIDISQRMFGEDKEFCKQQIINVQEKYPDLIINITRIEQNPSY